MSLSSGKAGELYRQHAADAVRLAYLLTGDRDRAEDVVQDAFVRLLGRFHDLRKPDSFGFYLRRTIVNLNRDHFRRLQRERTLTRSPVADAEIDQQLGRVDDRDELLQALQALPPRQRAAVVLRFCEGMSEYEAAEILGTSTGAVNSLVARGLATLRQRLGGGNVA